MTTTSMTTPHISDLIDGKRKTNRAARVARFLRTFVDVVGQTMT